MLAPLVSPNEAVANLQTDMATPKAHQNSYQNNISSGIKTELKIPDSGQMPTLCNIEQEIASQPPTSPSQEDEDQQKTPKVDQPENALSSQPSLLKRGLNTLVHNVASVRPFIIKHSETVSDDAEHSNEDEIIRRED